MPIIGIDLGTTNSLAAVILNGKPQLVPNASGEFLTPSCIGLDDDGETLLIGRTAKDRLITRPHLTASGFKRLMGTDTPISLGSRQYSAAELSGMLLRQLKLNAEAFLGGTVEEAVISVPAYFDDNCRNSVKEAGELAGLRVDRIINEPSAAALAYREKEEEDTTFMVFDLGGGTLDVTIVEAFDNIIEVISAAGDNHLGGMDFDLAIADWFCRESGLSYEALSPEDRSVLLHQSELAKKALNTADGIILSCSIAGAAHSVPLTGSTLVKISAGIFHRIETVISRALQDAETSMSRIDRVIMVGGSSRMVSIRSFIRELTGAELCDSIDPDLVVGIGTGLSAGIKMRIPELKDRILTDVCPFSLGVDTLNKAAYDDPLFSVIIPRNSSLPASRMHIYSTAHDYQTALKIRIYQGDSLHCLKNLELGSLDIGVPPAKAGEEKCEVRLSYDINGILEAEARCISTGAETSTVILSRKNRLSDRELAEKRADLEKLKILPRDEEQNRALLTRAEQLYVQCGETGSLEIFSMISYFTDALGSQDSRRIRAARATVTGYLDRLEARLSDFRSVFDRNDPDADPDGSNKDTDTDTGDDRE